MPTVYGCSSQQSSTPPATPSITLTQIGFSTNSYGTTLAASPTAITGAEAINTILTSPFTFPKDGLAQYYSDSDPTKQVFHSMNIQYSATNFTETDLPTDGNCEYQIEITNYSTASPSSSQLNTWPLEGNQSGVFLPNSSKAPGSRINSGGYNRAEVFEGLQTLGAVSLDGTIDSFPMDFLLLDGGGSVVEDNNTPRTTRIAFAAQNLGGTTTTFDMTVKILLADGTYASSGAITITVPPDAVKENLVVAETFTLESITITPQGSTPAGAVFPVESLPAGTSNPVILNTANNFTMGEESTYYQDERYESGGDLYVVGNSFEVSFDTSTLTPSNFPEFEIQAEIVISGTSATPVELGWHYEDSGDPPTQTFGWEAEERSQIITGGVVSPPIAWPANNDNPFQIEDNQNNSTFNVKVRIQQTSGSFVESNERTITIGEGAILPFVPI